MSQPYLVRALLLALGAASWLLLITGETQAKTIDTTYSDNEVKEASSSHAIVDTVAAGQTFSVDVDGVLQNFSFWVETISREENASIRFAAYVMEWNGTEATGRVLYKSSVYEKVAGSGFTRFDFEVPQGLNIESGKQYVAFVRIESPADSNAGIALEGASPLKPYDGGQGVSSGDSRSPETWAASGGDAAFFASFVSMEGEILGPGLAALGAAAAVGGIGGGVAGGGSSGGAVLSAAQMPDPESASQASSSVSLEDGKTPGEPPEDGQNVAPKPTAPEEPTAVPTPALLPGLAGLGLSALRRRKSESGAGCGTAKQAD